ncbi:leucine rich repeat containing protein [Anaeramoeba flamelloides]|uniref:Leucine rich repeat containing protein n=1 Tax=Anaeramoeba flamelloides TaxID=1746091 RepID=A0ABQ8XH91_9EUKA|nr:leucine rich repeat containing protein [Anaeramoeba flamelloides]
MGSACKKYKPKSTKKHKKSKKKAKQAYKRIKKVPNVQKGIKSVNFQVKKARKSQAKFKRFEFSSHSLLTIPNNVLKIKDIVTLSLVDNMIDQIPSRINKLHNLYSLNLSRNFLTSVPSEIGKLNLLTLDLSYNCLKTLPQEIGNLKKLESLNLKNNLISELPQEVFELKSLNYLYINENRLTAIPNDIGKLTSLIALYLNNNILSSLPSAIGFLDRLEILWVNTNQIRDLPNKIKYLQNLKDLRCNNNLLNSSCLTTIQHLRKLNRLELQYNSIEIDPRKILCKLKIEFIEIHENPFITTNEILAVTTSEEENEDEDKIEDQEEVEVEVEGKEKNDKNQCENEEEEEETCLEPKISPVDHGKSTGLEKGTTGLNFDLNVIEKKKNKIILENKKKNLNQKNKYFDIKCNIENINHGEEEEEEMEQKEEEMEEMEEMEEEEEEEEEEDDDDEEEEDEDEEDEESNQITTREYKKRQSKASMKKSLLNRNFKSESKIDLHKLYNKQSSNNSENGAQFNLKIIKETTLSNSSPKLLESTKKYTNKWEHTNKKFGNLKRTGMGHKFPNKDKRILNNKQNKLRMNRNDKSFEMQNEKNINKKFQKQFNKMNPGLDYGYTKIKEVYLSDTSTGNGAKYFNKKKTKTKNVINATIQLRNENNDKGFRTQNVDLELLEYALQTSEPSTDFGEDSLSNYVPQLYRKNTNNNGINFEQKISNLAQNSNANGNNKGNFKKNNNNQQKKIHFKMPNNYKDNVKKKYEKRNQKKKKKCGYFEDDQKEHVQLLFDTDKYIELDGYEQQSEQI